MPTEGPAQCLSQRISCRLLLARVSLQQSLPSQHVAPANRPSSGSSSGNPAEASRLFRWNLCVEMSLVSWKQLLHLHLIFLYVALNFRSFSPYSQPQGALQDQDPSNPSSTPRSRSPSSQPSAASRQRRRPGRGEGGRHGVPAFAVPSGPINEVLLNRPKESLELLKARRQHSALGPAAASLALVCANEQL